MKSIIPDKPEATGLIHFYENGGVWKFLSEEEYEAKKGELPALSFASRHPIEDFSGKSKTPEFLANLTLLKD